MKRLCRFTKALTACCAGGVGTIRLRMSVLPIGTTIPRRTGTTTTVSGWFAPEFCGVKFNRKTNRLPAKNILFFANTSCAFLLVKGFFYPMKTGKRFLKPLMAFAP